MRIYSLQESFMGKGWREIEEEQTTQYRLRVLVMSMKYIRDIFLF